MPFDDPEFAADVARTFSEAVAASPPTPRPAIIERPVAPVNLDLFADLTDDEDVSTTARIAFDAEVWQLRPDSGDFIHIRTGEVREEDEFLPLEEPAEWIEAAVD